MSKLLNSFNYLQLLQTVLKPDQAQQNVGPDLDLKTDILMLFL